MCVCVCVCVHHRIMNKNVGRVQSNVQITHFAHLVECNIYYRHSFKHKIMYNLIYTSYADIGQYTNKIIIIIIVMEVRS